MKANELRIGSTYNSVKFNVPVTLTAEDIWELVEKADGANISHYIDEMFTPVELTEQWLKDFGCKKLNPSGWVTIGATYWDKDGIVFYKNGNKYYMSIGEKTNKIGHHCIEFDKVHELQNIFALTGKELTK